MFKATQSVTFYVSLAKSPFSLELRIKSWMLHSLSVSFAFVTDCPVLWKHLGLLVGCVC